MNTSNLIDKYNVAGPRYTSYPTVPYWQSSTHTEDRWKQSLRRAFTAGGREVSIYIHLPYCESLCTYCGCTTKITKNHSVEEPYLKLLAKEWKLYIAELPFKPILRELHLGGGTPTFFSPANLEKLITMFTKTCDIPDRKDWGFEGHPNNTTYKHMEVLRQLGFNRISFGIQDFDPQVQQKINRIQPFYKVKACTDAARELEYNSINFDLVYGLPLQTADTVRETINKTLELAPSRLAFYGYAHLPRLKPAQNKLTPFLPEATQRAELYQLGKQLFTSKGYTDIGMDHFALPTDSLAIAAENGELHRNFMGYTTRHTGLSIGLGMSAVSDSWDSFSQNEKSLKKYARRLEQNQLPILRGHTLTNEDLYFRQHILNLMCRYETKWYEDEFCDLALGINFDLLEDLKQDGLVNWNQNSLSITEKGKPFVRNVCMAFDIKLWQQQTQNVFSRTV